MISMDTSLKYGPVPYNTGRWPLYLSMLYIVYLSMLKKKQNKKTTNEEPLQERNVLMRAAKKKKKDAGLLLRTIVC